MLRELLAGSQMNKPEPYGRPLSDHPVDKALARYRRVGELKGHAVGNGTEPQHAEHDPALDEIHQIHQRIAHIEGALHHG